MTQALNQNLGVIPEASPLKSLIQALANPQLSVLGLELLLAVPLGCLLYHFNPSGIAWILAGLFSGGLAFQFSRSRFHTVPKPNRTARKVGMALVGMAIGFSMTQGHLADLVGDLPLFVSLTGLLLFSGVAIGYLYARLSRINLLTAMLATVPGGVGVMSSLAADYGRNVPLVALVQIMRVAAVICFIPWVAKGISGQSASSQTLAVANGWLNFDNFDLSQVGWLSLALAATASGVYLSSRLQIPAAPFFGSVLVGILFNPIFNALPFAPIAEFSPPPLIGLLGQILLGITIGEYWGAQPPLGKRTIAAAGVSVVLTIGAGFVAALIALQLTDWDWLTCMLVTAPGGAPEMILVALSLNHQVETVTAAHLVRLIAINSSLPLWLWLFQHLDRRLPIFESNSSSQQAPIQE
jgi:hypothetical protein